MAYPGWDPRRLTAVKPDLPDGVTPDGTRGRVLHAALALFAEFGFHGTSVRDIARQVGINAATLYAHYPSKEDVLAELVVLGHVGLHNGLQAALRDCGEAATATEQLIALVGAQVGLHADYPLLAVVANNELHALSAGKAAPALALRERCRHLLYEVLERGVSSGEFVIDDIVLAGIAIGSIGLRVANWFGPDQPYTREKVIATFAEYALRIAGRPHEAPRF